MLRVARVKRKNIGKVVARAALVLKHVGNWFFCALAAILGADCGKLRRTAVFRQCITIRTPIKFD